MILSPQYECQGDRGAQASPARPAQEPGGEPLLPRALLSRRKFDAAGVKPRDLRSLDDIAKLPLHGQGRPPRRPIPTASSPAPSPRSRRSTCPRARPASPSSTPTPATTSSAGRRPWRRTLSGAGATRHDTVQNCYGYGLFTGGLGAHYGAKRIGANIIPMSSGNTAKQLMVMRDFGTTILTCTPSYALFMAEEARRPASTSRRMKLRAGCFGAEPWSENMRKQIEAELGIDAYDIYGLTEITGPGVAFECECKDGMHVNEDLFYPEIIDPGPGKPLPDGEKGELVFTTLVKEGTPLLRYRTRDVTYPHPGHLRLRPHDGQACTASSAAPTTCSSSAASTSSPRQIEHALIEIEGTDPNYVIVVDRGATYLDEVELQVEVKHELFSDETKTLETLKQQDRVGDEVEARHHAQASSSWSPRPSSAAWARRSASSTSARFESREGGSHEDPADFGFPREQDRAGSPTSPSSSPTRASTSARSRSPTRPTSASCASSSTSRPRPLEALVQGRLHDAHRPTSSPSRSRTCQAASPR